MTLTYRLDDLGWHEFERLIQALLKEKLGVGVEAWGGSGDWGRDAYFVGQLEYPTTIPSSGSFVFQCKFAEMANAAGANAAASLLNSVRKERTRIKERLEEGTWEAVPTHYALLTNAPISPELRTEIVSILSSTLDTAHIHIHPGEDICSWLRNVPALVKSCPQLLSLRDLEALLGDIVNAETITRSHATISLAEAEAKVFVPTKAYYEARDKLQKHYFVILEGPPEMGKTTIGRIIALSQMCDGWEALEVRTPDEVLKTYKRNESQVFVADDFFGRTEYDPAAVSRWQAELAHILPLLGSRHWLILTSRIHLLELAKQKLDIAGQNNRFPSLSEVVVTASSLEKSEKARILYRHAKAAALPSAARIVIKQSAKEIVGNHHFTPERIRRLILEVIPQFIDEKPDSGIVTTKIREAITNPTQQMRVSFRSLPETHKWLLWSMLNSSFHNSALAKPRELKEIYDRLCPIESHRPFDQVFNELSQGFVRKNERYGYVILDWIHPSCRDLAIEELANSGASRSRFITFATEAGLMLAVSIGGGRGERDLPLLINDTDWLAFGARAKQIISQNSFFCEHLRGSLESLEQREPTKPELKSACARLRKLFTEQLVPLMSSILSIQAFEHTEGLMALARTCKYLEIPVDLQLDHAWVMCEAAARKWDEEDFALWEHDTAPTQIEAFFSAVRESLPAAFETAASSGRVSLIISLIAGRIDRELKKVYHFDDEHTHTLEEMLSAFKDMAENLTALSQHPGVTSTQKEVLCSSATYFTDIATELEDYLPSESDGSEIESGSNNSSREVSIDALFSDL